MAINCRGRRDNRRHLTDPIGHFLSISCTAAFERSRPSWRTWSTMDDPRSSRLMRMCVRACVHSFGRARAHVCTCTHFRCRLIDAERAAHTHRVNLRSVERFAASSSCSFSPRLFPSSSRSLYSHDIDPVSRLFFFVTCPLVFSPRD